MSGARQAAASQIWLCDRCGRLSAIAPPAGAVCPCCGAGAWSRRPPPPAGDPIACRHDDHRHAWPPARQPIWLWRTQPFRACGLCGRLSAAGTGRRMAACSCGGLLVDRIADLPAPVVLVRDGPRSVGTYAHGMLDAVIDHDDRHTLRAALSLADRLAGRGRQGGVP